MREKKFFLYWTFAMCDLFYGYQLCLYSHNSIVSFSLFIINDLKICYITMKVWQNCELEGKYVGGKYVGGKY